MSPKKEDAAERSSGIEVVEKPHQGCLCDRCVKFLSQDEVAAIVAENRRITAAAEEKEARERAGREGN